MALLLLAACRQPAPVTASNCAVRPVDFLDWADFPANVGGARWIAPPGENTIRLASADALFWNGVGLGGLEDTRDVAVLDMYLAQVAQMTPQPFTAFTFTDGVSCAKVERIRDLMRRRLACATTRRCFQGPPPTWLTPAEG